MLFRSRERVDETPWGVRQATEAGHGGLLTAGSRRTARHHGAAERSLK